MTRALITAVAALFALWPSLSQAEPVRFAEPNDQERAVLRSVYAEFLSKNPAAKVKTATVAFDSSQVGSLLVRFETPDYCAGKSCYTVALKWIKGAWKPVFERRTTTVELAQPLAKRPVSLDIVVDGRERWSWAGNAFLADVRSVGAAVSPSERADRAVAEAARTTFGKQAAMSEMLARAEWAKAEITYLQAKVDLGLVPGFIVSAEGPLCGLGLGCPQVIVVKDGKSFKAVGQTYSHGLAAVSAAKSKGMRDIAFSDARGYHVLRWDGSGYREAATSYPSPLTPLP